MEAGDYEIILESFDAASSVRSALKTDKITVKVIPIAPGLSIEPELVVLSPEEPSKWQLPPTNPGSFELAAVTVTIPASLTSVVRFDQDSQTFTFDGLSSSSSLAGHKFLFKIVIESKENTLQSTYMQMVQILDFKKTVDLEAEADIVPEAEEFAAGVAVETDLEVSYPSPAEVAAK